MSNQELIDGLLEVREEVVSNGGFAFGKRSRLYSVLNAAIAALRSPIKAPCPACGDSGVIRNYVERPGPAGKIEVRCPCGSGK